MAAISSPETAGAMKSDGLLRDTVKVFVFDKELAISSTGRAARYCLTAT